MADYEMATVYEDHLRRLHADGECACTDDADAQDAILADADAERARQEAVRALALFFLLVLLGILAVHIANKGGL